MALLETLVGVLIVAAGFVIAVAPMRLIAIVVQVLGIIVLLAAAGLLVVGRTRLDSFLDWWMARPQSFLRIWSIVAFGFGALLIYSGA